MNFFDAGFELLEKLVVYAFIDDGARAGRTFLPLKTESRLRLDGGINVGVGVDDDRVLAAHFKNGTFDPDLAGRLGGRDFINVQSNFARAGEGDVARLGMRHNRVAETGARAGAKIYHAFGHAGLFEQINKLRRDGGRIARRLQNNGVAADDGRHRHARHDGARKIPRRNHRAHAQRNVMQRVMLAGQLDGRLRLRKTQRLARVELAEVDGLGNVGIGLGPVLADLENQPRHKFHLALAHQISNVEQQPGALFDRSAAPRFEGGERGLHGRFYVIFVRLLMDADNLRRLRRVQRLDFVRSPDPLAADDQVVLAAQLAAHLGNGGAHLARVIFVAKIEKRLRNERALMQTGTRPNGGFERCHGGNPFTIAKFSSRTYSNILHLAPRPIH